MRSNLTLSIVGLNLLFSKKVLDFVPIKTKSFFSFSVLAAPVIKASVYIAEDWSK